MNDLLRHRRASHPSLEQSRVLPSGGAPPHLVEVERRPMAPPHRGASVGTSAPRWIDRWTRRALFRALDGFPLVVEETNGAYRLGDAPQARLRVYDPRAYSSIVFRGSVGAGESYAAGLWDTNDLTGLLRLVAARTAASRGLGRPWGLVWERVRHALRPNTRSGSRKNIHAHYDLGDEFFELFLDDTLTYSSALFPRPGATLREGSIEKLDRVCRRLGLGPEDHVLEIGTGWGSFALHAARHYGCRVTTTTISRNQAERARARVHEAGLSDRIEVCLSDYRDLRGQYDKLVSIEMIEAVGHRYYDSFFSAAHRLLAPQGAALMQAILIQDDLYDRARKTVDFIKHHIFPGSCIPALGVLRESVSRVTDWQEHECARMGRHYAETLARWRQTLDHRWAEAQDLGVSEHFLRSWRFYFAYCEAGFLENRLDVGQILWSRPGWRPPENEPLPQGCSWAFSGEGAKSR